MQLGSLLNAVQEYSFNLARDLQDYVEVQSGKAFCQQAQIEQVQVDNSDGEQQQSNRLETEEFEDFQLEVDQPNVDTGSSIKTYQFNSGMFAPSKIQNKPIDSQPKINLSLEQCFGFNSKDKSSCVILSSTSYCFAVGCQLVLSSLVKEGQQRSYGMFQEHVYEICRIIYQPKLKILISGSKGLKPELIVWNFVEKNLSLNLMNKFRLSRNFEGIGQITFLNQTKILCTNSISIHRGNELRLFDIESGDQIKFEKKVKAKIFDCFVDHSSQNKFYLATNEGVMALSNIQSDLQVKVVGEKKNYSITICCFKKYILTGDQNGNIEIATTSGKRVSKNNVHKGLVFNMQIIPEKSILLTSGTEDNQVKIHLLTQKQSSLALNLSDTLKLNSYCTSISHVDEQNVLLGFRDGSIIVYDCKNKIRKFEKLSHISYVDHSSSKLLCYNQAIGRVLFTYNKNTLCQLIPKKYSSKDAQPKITRLKGEVKCVAVYQDKILQVCSTKDKKYVLSINKILSQSTQAPILLNFETNKQGKPKKAAFNQDLAVVGTKLGYLIILLLSKPVTLISDENHTSEIEEIVLQEGKFKPSQPFYVKTVSGSELFYWQIQLVEDKLQIKTINKAGPLKNLTWSSACKYSWESRAIWEEMTHYLDIESIAKIADKFICVAMNDGKLRIYRYPATKGKYIEYKIFPDKFNLLSCHQNYLLCQRNYQFLLLNLAPLES